MTSGAVFITLLFIFVLILLIGILIKSRTSNFGNYLHLKFRIWKNSLAASLMILSLRLKKIFL